MSPKRICFFSICFSPRSSRVFLNSFLSLGLIVQSGNLHVDPASTWYRLGISFLTRDFFHMHLTDPWLRCPTTSWTVHLCVSQFPQFQLPKIELPTENLYFPTALLIPGCRLCKWFTAPGTNGVEVLHTAHQEVHPWDCPHRGHPSLGYKDTTWARLHVLPWQ